MASSVGTSCLSIACPHPCLAAAHLGAHRPARSHQRDQYAPVSSLRTDVRGPSQRPIRRAHRPRLRPTTFARVARAMLASALLLLAAVATVCADRNVTIRANVRLRSADTIDLAQDLQRLSYFPGVCTAAVTNCAGYWCVGNGLKRSELIGAPKVRGPTRQRARRATLRGQHDQRCRHVNIPGLGHLLSDHVRRSRSAGRRLRRCAVFRPILRRPTSVSTA